MMARAVTPGPAEGSSRWQGPAPLLVLWERTVQLQPCCVCLLRSPGEPPTCSAQPLCFMDPVQLSGHHPRDRSTWEPWPVGIPHLHGRSLGNLARQRGGSGCWFSQGTVPSGSCSADQGSQASGNLRSPKRQMARPGQVSARDGAKLPNVAFPCTCWGCRHRETCVVPPCPGSVLQSCPSAPVIHRASPASGVPRLPKCFCTQSGPSLTEDYEPPRKVAYVTLPPHSIPHGHQKTQAAAHPALCPASLTCPAALSSGWKLHGPRAFSGHWRRQSGSHVTAPAGTGHGAGLQPGWGGFISAARPPRHKPWLRPGDLSEGWRAQGLWLLWRKGHPTARWTDTLSPALGAGAGAQQAPAAGASPGAVSSLSIQVGARPCSA